MTLLQLVLNEKGFLGRMKTFVLHQGEGPIRSIKWKSTFIAWSNDQVSHDFFLMLSHCINYYNTTLFSQCVIGTSS